LRKGGADEREDGDERAEHGAALTGTRASLRGPAERAQRAE